MKKLILFFVVILTTQTVWADCRPIFREHLDKKGNDIAWIIMGGGVGAGLVVGAGVRMMTYIGAGFVPGLIAFGGVAVSGGTAFAITKYRHNRMIRLIDQAEKYVNNDGNIYAGKQLLKLHEKVDLDFSLLELAELIKKSNEDGSLCSNDDLLFFNELKKEIKDGRFDVIYE